MHVVRPSLSKFMKDGQILQVTAAEGQIYVEPAGRDNYKPKRGTLTKDVEIRIDLTTRQWRQSHPDFEAMDRHPEHVIRIKMDSLYFDDDLSLIRSDGAVKVQSAKFDVDSKGLRLVYGRQEDRLEHLEILHGGTIVLRGTFNLGDNPLLTAGQTHRQRRSLARPPVRMASATASVAPATRPVTTRAASTAAAASRFVDVYVAAFEGPVHVKQLRGEKTIAHLDADKLLDITFDVGPRSRQSAELVDTHASASGAAATRSSTKSAQKDAADVEVPDKDRAIVTWAGKLDIAATKRQPADEAGRTTLIHAAGQQVVLADESNTIECTDLLYDAVRRSGRIRSVPPMMAKIADVQGRYLAGHDIRFDQAGVMDGTLQIIGAGEAVESPAGQTLVSADANAISAEGPTRIEWHKGLSMRFRRASLSAGLGIRPVLPLRLPDKRAAATLAMYEGVFAIPQDKALQALSAGPLKGLVAESAVISGAALVQRGADSICSEELRISFFPTVGEGKTFGPIRTARGTGGVSLTTKAEAGESQARSISADQLDVEFERASASRSNPRHALATGHAVVVQGPSKIEADHIDATLSPVVEAPAEGAAASRPAQTSREKVAVSNLVATGNVRITDPKRPLNLVAERLKASIANGKTIDVVAIEGAGDEPATVSTAEYAIAAPIIRGNLKVQDIAVPAGGELTLQVRQDLQGRKLTEAQPLRIRWTDHMQMHGERNVAEFVGQVHAVQTNATTGRKELDFAGDRMEVYLRPVSESVAPEPAEKTSPQRLARFLDKAREQLVEAFPAAEGWAPARDDSAAGMNASGAAREPIRIEADGNAKAEMPRYNDTGNILTSRLLAVGPKFVVDLERQQMEIEGKGNLLVENYGIAELANDPRASDPQAVMAEARCRPDSGLSQTVFSWQNAMLFILPDREAVFDGGVNMIHLAGGKIRFGGELATALGAKIDLLRTMPGREATLNCDNLRVQFAQAAAGADSSQWMQRAKLANLIADGKMVSLDEHLSNGGTNMVTASRLQYNGQRDTFVVQGSPARLVRQENAEAISNTTAADTFYWKRNSDQGPGHDQIEITHLRGQAFQ